MENGSKAYFTRSGKMLLSVCMYIYTTIYLYYYYTLSIQLNIYVCIYNVYLLTLSYL